MFKPFRGRRPSASMVVSLVALFFALGGVGYAASTLPPGSVGSAQLQRGAVRNSKIHNNAITWNKIVPGTIGSGRINQALVQVRVTGTCSGVHGAIGSILQSGRVTCNPSASAEFGSNGASTPVTGTSATLASRPLPGGTYLVMGSVYATNSAGVGNPANVSCTLSVPGGSSQTQSVTVPTANGTGHAALQINVASSVPTAGATATLSCNQTGTPVTGVTASGQINAIQTSSNS